MASATTLPIASAQPPVGGDPGPSRGPTDTDQAAPNPTTQDPTARTPVVRDPAMDLLRAAALAIVVLGHWLIAVIHWDDGTLRAHNLLDVEPVTQWLTWLFQPMPLFFAVGGWAAAQSWTRREPRSRATEWVAARCRRLLGPVISYGVVAVTVSGVIVAIFGADAQGIGALFGMHLWFLAVYLPVTAATPWLVDAVTSHGWRVPVAFAVMAVAVDVARFVLGVPGVGWANFAFLWLGFATFGIALALQPPARSRLFGVAALGGVTLVAVVALGWYPHSMVGVGNRSNNTPPTVALGLLGLTQITLVWTGMDHLRRWLHRRPRTHKMIGAVGVISMHVYLWHLCAVVIATALMRTGFANIEPLSTMWWATRPLWWLALATLTAPIVTVALRHDRRRLPRADPEGSRPTGQSPIGSVVTGSRHSGSALTGARLRVVASTGLATAALATIALGGVVPGTLSFGSLAALAVAARLVRDR